MGAVLICLLAAEPSATTDATLTRAAALIGDLKFKQANVMLTPLREARDLDHQQVVRLLELLARAAGSQGKADEAKALFEQLLEIEPEFTLQGRGSPKITAPFFEAKAAVFKRGALGVSVTFTETGGSITGARLALKGRQGPLARFAATIDEDGVSRAVVLNLGDFQVRGKAVSVSVRALDQRGWALVVDKFERTATPVLVPREKPVETPVVTLVAPAPEVPRARPWRTVAIVSLGGTVISAVTGVVFYTLGANAQGELQRAIQERAGDVVPLSFVRAGELNQRIALGRDVSLASWAATALFGALTATAWLIDLLGSQG